MKYQVWIACKPECPTYQPMDRMKKATNDAELAIELADIHQDDNHTTTIRMDRTQ